MKYGELIEREDVRHLIEDISPQMSKMMALGTIEIIDNEIGRDFANRIREFVKNEYKLLAKEEVTLREISK